MGKQEIAFRY